MPPELSYMGTRYGDIPAVRSSRRRRPVGDPYAVTAAAISELSLTTSCMVSPTT
jgi:hypothetical protein